MSLKRPDSGIQVDSVLPKGKTDLSLASDVFLKSLVHKYYKKVSWLSMMLFGFCLTCESVLHMLIDQ